MKRSAPLARRTPLRSGGTKLSPAPGLRRSKWTTRKRPKKRADADPARLAWCRALPCCAPTSEPCRRPSVAHHHCLYGAGMAQKAPDSAVMPLCDHHHTGDHGVHRALDPNPRGPFAGMDRERLKAWQDEQVAHCRAAYEAHLARKAA